MTDFESETKPADRYGGGRSAARFINIVGLLVILAGVVGAMISAGQFQTYAGNPMLGAVAIAYCLAMALLGLMLAAGGQVMLAAFDTADNTKAMLEQMLARGGGAEIPRSEAMPIAKTGQS
jgi:hypothetical protein